MANSQPCRGSRYLQPQFGNASYESVRDPTRSVSRPEVQLPQAGLSSLPGDSVKISTPVWVTPTECSNCADSERSRVTAVQPSDRIFTCGLPRLIIGSIVKNIPG